jgi:hypothetical protein
MKRPGCALPPYFLNKGDVGPVFNHLNPTSEPSYGAGSATPSLFWAGLEVLCTGIGADLEYGSSSFGKRIHPGYPEA